MAAKPYDPTLKALVETEPESWPALLGRPAGPTTVIDADVATISGAADKVLRVAAEPPYLLHLEFVAGHDSASLPRKLLVRNGLLEDRHETRVRSAAVLLRPDADSPQLTGLYERGFPGEEIYLTFRYQVVRVWRLPPDPLLTGGLALLPLAPISAVTEAELPGIIQRMGRRLESRRARRLAEVVWAASYLLLGLRYSPGLAAQLFRGVVSMKESSTYQAILEEGRAEGRAEGRIEGAVAEAKRTLRLQGDDAFGPPDARGRSYRAARRSAAPGRNAPAREDGGRLARSVGSAVLRAPTRNVLIRYGNLPMHYEYIAIPDADIPQAVDPTFQHVLTTYASEANKTASMWRAIPDDVLDFKPHEKTNSIRTILVHQLLSERRFFAQFVGTEEPAVEELLPPGEKPVVQAYLDKYVGLVKRRLPQLAMGTSAWWLERRPFFGGLQRERIWVFWRRVLHTCHHRTQVQSWLRLAGRHVPAIYGPSGDVTWDEADPTYSLEAAKRGGK